ncbi:general transcription factor IIH subunit 2-like [Penaeus chinensis]|uniref:general transcription factor IIH subunit 2-like n=1 Tax=Penaeus chinensis TaxID=139456 RepID=UPI001FB62215|nr:general transcription factor IIH subunit 2-like [Penaeus chinensis]
MNDDDDPKEYRWQSGYEKTWEAIQEDDSGRLEPSVTDMIRRAKRRKLLDREASVRLGIMRHVFIILDLSQAMAEQDLKPTRQICTLKILDEFIREFHDQNPISQLGIIATQNKVAKRHSELSNNPQRHLDCIKRLHELPCRGEPSMQNSLEYALSALRHLPPHTSREILIIYAALTTCDPGEIETTIQKVKDSNIRVSVVGISAELHVCKMISKDTGGSFSVSINDLHLKELIFEHLEPPPASVKMDHTLIKVGFPHQVNTDARPALCMCHLDDLPPLNTRGYYCPQCTAKYCDLPAECRVCGLMLVTAPHLARSYRHLFPLKHFEEVPIEEDQSFHCYGCLKQLTVAASDKNVYICRICKQVFCFECDIFLHETVHSCPGCASNPTISQYSTS